jgi:hypothetical protein
MRGGGKQKNGYNSVTKDALGPSDIAITPALKPTAHKATGSREVSVEPDVSGGLVRRAQMLRRGASAAVAEQ